jgi:hypothetical protein
MRKVLNEELCNVYLSPKWSSEPVILLRYIHVLWRAGNSEKYLVEKTERIGMQGRIFT